jgi:protein-tyrosine-phosphatase
VIFVTTQEHPELDWVVTLDRKECWAFLASRKMDRTAVGMIVNALSLVEEEPHLGGPWRRENDNLKDALRQVVEVAMQSDY